MLNADEIKFLKNYGARIIPENRNYWLVRTQGGDFFQEFYLSNFIAIGWNKIDDLNLIKDESRHDELIELIKSNYKDDSKPGLTANQIRKFVKEMKKGDIVIIPSENSKFIAYGELLDNDIYLNQEIDFILDEGDCDYIKRRRVKWLKHQHKENMDIYMYRVLSNHQTISSVNNSDDIIDRTLYDFYIKGDLAHYKVNVNQEKEISALDFSGYIYNTISLVDTYNELFSENMNKRSINTKTNINSPGIIAFAGPIAVISCIAIATNILLGGECGFFGIKFKTDGLSKNILEWVKTINEIKMKKEEMKYAREREIIESARNLMINSTQEQQIEFVLDDLDEAAATNEEE